MSLPIGTKIMILSSFDRTKLSNRTRNKLHEHGASGFIILSDPTHPSFDSSGGKWIRVESVEKNVSLAKWGGSGKEPWIGWLPLDEIRIKDADNI